jgi:hypothetical protein
MKLLYKQLSPNISENIAGEIVGWHSYKKDLLVRLPQRGYGLTAIITKCGGCGKDFPEIYLGTRADLINEYGNTVEEKVEIYGAITSLFLCDKCSYNKMLEIASSLFCEGCNKQIAWLEAGTTADASITIVAGKEYVIPECSKCNENIDTIDIREAKIREVSKADDDCLGPVFRGSTKENKTDENSES